MSELKLVTKNEAAGGKPPAPSAPKSMYARLCFAYEGGLIRRFHTRSGIEPCTTGSHCYGVATLCYFLSEGVPSANLLLEALTHDLGEHFTGDVPAPTKWAMEEARFDLLEDAIRDEYDLRFPLTEAERRTLHMADTMEGILWCAKEISMGNKRAARPGIKWAEKVKREFEPSFTPKQAEVWNAIVTIWRECNGEEGCTKYDVYER